MSEHEIDRREFIKLAKLGVLLSAGLGVSKVVDASTGEELYGQQKSNSAEKIKGEHTLVSKVLKLYEGNARDGFQLKLSVPIRGDLSTALNDPEAQLTLRVASRDRASGRWKVYINEDVTVSKAKTSDRA